MATNWTRQPQERTGTYTFTGQFYTTRGVANELSADEILFIYQDVQAFARERKGIDYLQVYTNEKKEKIYVIDQLNMEMVASGDYDEIENYCTLMFASEY